MSEQASTELPVPPAVELMLAGFRCTASCDGVWAVWVRVSGEVDLLTGRQLELTLRSAEQYEMPCIVLVLYEVTFMDSSGAHLIHDASKRARVTGRRLLTLVGGGSPVHRLLTLADLDELIEIFDVPQVNPHRIGASPGGGRSKLPPIDRFIAPPHPGDSPARPASRPSVTRSREDSESRPPVTQSREDSDSRPPVTHSREDTEIQESPLACPAP